MRTISRISRNSRTSSISTSFVNRITHNVNLCFTNNRRNLRNRQTIDFKLPHDVVCACAKRDEPPSRRRPFQFFLDQNNILSTNSSETRPTSARHSVSSVFSVDYKKFASIRVHSWFQINGLAVFFNGLPRQSHPFLRAVFIAFQRLHILQRDVETRSFQCLDALLQVIPRHFFPIVAD